MGNLGLGGLWEVLIGNGTQQSRDEYEKLMVAQQQMDRLANAGMEYMIKTGWGMQNMASLEYEVVDPAIRAKAQEMLLDGMRLAAIEAGEEE